MTTQPRIRWDDPFMRRRVREALIRNDPTAAIAPRLCEMIGVPLDRINLRIEGQYIWFDVVEETHKLEKMNILAGYAHLEYPQDVDLAVLLGKYRMRIVDSSATMALMQCRLRHDFSTDSVTHHNEVWDTAAGCWWARCPTCGELENGTYS